MKKEKKDFESIKALNELLKNNAWEGELKTAKQSLNAVLKKMFKYSDKLATNMNIAYVKYTCDTQEEKNGKNQRKGKS